MWSVIAEAIALSLARMRRWWTEKGTCKHSAQLGTSIELVLQLAYDAGRSGIAMRSARARQLLSSVRAGMTAVVFTYTELAVAHPVPSSTEAYCHQ